MFVRTAAARDIDAVRALIAETLHATCDAVDGAAHVAEMLNRRHSVAALKALLDEPRSEFLVADDGETIAGMAFAIATADGLRVVLKQLCVRPSFQGRGIGGLLLDEIEGSFHDAVSVGTEVVETDARAVSFYLSQGFSETARTTDRDGVAMIVFERPIVWAD